jgi:hypothetical protein
MLERDIHRHLCRHRGYLAVQAINGVGRTIAAILVAEIGDRPARTNRVRPPVRRQRGRSWHRGWTPAWAANPGGLRYRHGAGALTYGVSRCPRSPIRRCPAAAVVTSTSCAEVRRLPSTPAFVQIAASLLSICQQGGGRLGALDRAGRQGWLAGAQKVHRTGPNSARRQRTRRTARTGTPAHSTRHGLLRTRRTSNASLTGFRVRPRRCRCLPMLEADLGSASLPIRLPIFRRRIGA